MFRKPTSPGVRTGLTFISTNTTASPEAQSETSSPPNHGQAGNIYVSWSIQQTTMSTSPSPPTQAQAGQRTTSQRRPSQHKRNAWAIAAHRGQSTSYSMAQTSGRSNNFPSWINNRVDSHRVKWLSTLSRSKQQLHSHPQSTSQSSEHPTTTDRYAWRIRLHNLRRGSNPRRLLQRCTRRQRAAESSSMISRTRPRSTLFELNRSPDPAPTAQHSPHHPNIGTGVADPSGDAQVPHYSQRCGCDQPA